MTSIFYCLISYVNCLTAPTVTRQASFLHHLALWSIVCCLLFWRYASIVYCLLSFVLCLPVYKFAWLRSRYHYHHNATATATAIAHFYLPVSRSRFLALPARWRHRYSHNSTVFQSKVLRPEVLGMLIWNLTTENINLRFDTLYFSPMACGL